MHLLSGYCLNEYGHIIMLKLNFNFSCEVIHLVTCISKIILSFYWQWTQIMETNKMIKQNKFKSDLFEIIK